LNIKISSRGELLAAESDEPRENAHFPGAVIIDSRNQSVMTFTPAKGAAFDRFFGRADVEAGSDCRSNINKITRLQPKKGGQHSVRKLMKMEIPGTEQSEQSGNDQIDRDDVVQ
jgi:hypothetical protein